MSEQLDDLPGQGDGKGGWMDVLVPYVTLFIGELPDAQLAFQPLPGCHAVDAGRAASACALMADGYDCFACLYSHLGVTWPPESSSPIVKIISTKNKTRPTLPYLKNAAIVYTIKEIACGGV